MASIASNIIKFNFNPPRPDKAKSYDLDPNVAERWIATYDQKYHEALKELISKVRRISFPEFCTALTKCVENLPKAINGKATILITPDKSNQWVAEIACCFNKFTGKYQLLGHDDARDYVEFLDTAKPRDLPRDVVLFDDAGYSGKQMARHVEAIVKKMGAIKAKGNIHVVVPFATSIAFDKIKKIEAGPGIHINIVIPERIKTVKESMSPENYKLLMEIFEQLTEEDSGITATYLDSKVPNGSSFILYGNNLLPAINPPYIGSSKGERKEGEKYP